MGKMAVFDKMDSLYAQSLVKGEEEAEIHLKRSFLAQPKQRTMVPTKCAWSWQGSESLTCGKLLSFVTQRIISVQNIVIPNPSPSLDR